MVGVIGVGDIEGDNVTVTVGVSVRAISSSVRCKEKKTITAPMVRNRASNPMTAGKLRVILGIRLPRSGLSVSSEALESAVSSLPHTRQRVAFSLSWVPQVGHSFLLFAEFSTAIVYFVKLNVLLSGNGGDYTSLLLALRIGFQTGDSSIPGAFWVSPERFEPRYYCT